MDKRKLEEIFDISIFVKLIHGIFEIISGAVLLIVSESAIKNFFGFIFRNEIAEDKSDLFVGFFLWLFQNPHFDLKTFAGIYLIIFGIVNSWLAFILLTKKVKHYKFVEIILFVLIIYQIYQFVKTFSPLILLLIIIDSVILVLIFKYHKYLLKYSSTNIFAAV